MTLSGIEQCGEEGAEGRCTGWVEETLAGKSDFFLLKAIREGSLISSC